MTRLFAVALGLSLAASGCQSDSDLTPDAESTAAAEAPPGALGVAGGRLGGRGGEGRPDLGEGVPAHADAGEVSENGLGPGERVRGAVMEVGVTHRVPRGAGVADGLAEVGVADAGRVGADALAEAGEEHLGDVASRVAVGGEALGRRGGLRLGVAGDGSGAVADDLDGVFDVLDASPSVGKLVEVGEGGTEHREAPAEIVGHGVAG